MGARESVRRVAIALSALISALYLLIGLNVVSIGAISAGGQAAFGLPAMVVFAAGAVVALVWDKRWLWIVGAIGLAVIIFLYFNLAAQRVPEFETWGIVIRVLQFLLLACLIYLGATDTGR